jgi:hypothetical protein
MARNYRKNFTRKNFKRRFNNNFNSKSKRKLGTLQRMTGVRPKRSFVPYGQLVRRVENINSRLSSETKFIDTPISLAVDDSLVEQLSICSEGSGPGDRIGTRIKYRSLTCKYIVLLADAYNLVPPVAVRVSIILDKKPKMGIPIWSTIYTGNNVTALVDLQGGDRFVILKTHGFLLYNTYMRAVTFEDYIDLKDINAEWEGSLATDMEKNAIYLVANSSVGIGLNPPVIVGNARLRYFDN